jgi:hypothetical protein
MKALLKVAGIDSYYTLVKSGDGKSLLTDIPCNQFDHVILCVPESRDTIWLECTNPQAPFNYLGSFTCDREVLAITPDGGKILRTPAYGSNVNTVNTYTDIALAATGDASIILKIEKSGMLYDEILQLSENKPDERKLWLSNQIGFAAFDLKKEEYVFSLKGQVPSAGALYELHLRDLASKTNTMLFVTPSFFSGLSFIMNEPVEIELDKAYQQKDSVRIEVPSDYLIEYLPEGKHIVTRFGSYSSNVTADGHYIYFSRRLIFNKASYPVETYPAFYRFISDLAGADKEVLVLKSQR